MTGRTDAGDGGRAPGKPMRFELVTIGLLLVLGAVLRLYALNDYPLGVQQDELSDIYDGWSILQTGADRFGDRWPLQLRAFGENDYRPAMYAWLAVIPLKLFGFSVAAGRLPSAVLGIASLVLIYLFARRVGGQRYGLLALTLGVLSPLHIQYSRIAHEGTMLPGFFLILTLLAWHAAASRSYEPSRALLLGLATGLSADPYQSSKLIALLIAILVVVDIARHATRRMQAIAIFSIGAAIGASPQILALYTDPVHFFARARVLSVSAGGGPAFVWDVITGFVANLAPRYLFVPREISDLSVARLLPPEALFFYVGLIALALVPFKGIRRARWAIYLALVIAILPAALTTGNPNTIRASGFTVLSPLFSAAGIVWLYDRFVANWRWRRAYYPLVMASLVLSASGIIYRYSQSLMFREAYFQNFLVLLGKKIGAHQRDYSRVLVQNHGSQVHLYVAAFGGISPRDFQVGPRNSWSDGMDHITRVGKFQFVSPAELNRAVTESGSDGDERTLFVATERVAGLVPIDSVAFQQEKAYLMVRPVAPSRTAPADAAPE